jgi:CheY-like chemotaxis protein
MKKILIVEDVEYNRDLLVQLLEDEYCITSAVDGEAGLRLAEQGRPDLILMDLSLLLLDGWEVTRRLKVHPALRSIPIIALTAHAMPGDAQRALESGCDAYLSKPVDEDRLFELLRRWLGTGTR